MVNFNFSWGGSSVSLENSENRIADEMKEYLRGNNRNFINNLANAKESVDEEQREILQDHFEEIYNSLGKEKLKSFLSDNMYESYISDKVKSERIPNAKNKSFLDSFTIQDLNDNSKLDKLIGLGNVHEDLEDFSLNANELARAYKDNEYVSWLTGNKNKKLKIYKDSTKVDIRLEQVPYTEKELDEGIQALIPRFNIGDKHFIFSYPINSQRLIELKADAIEDKIKQRPTFIQEKSKIEIPPIIKKFSIDLTPIKEELEKVMNHKDLKLEKLIDDGKGGFKREVVKVSRLDFFTNYKPIDIESYKEGESKYLEKDGVRYELVSSLSQLNNTSFDIDLDGKTEETILDKFIKNLLELESQVFDDYNEDVMKVFTYTVEGSIKNELKSVSNPLSKILDNFLNSNKKVKLGKKDLASFTITTKTKNGNFKTKSATMEEIEALEERAWTEKNTGKTISNDEYQLFDDYSERLKYIPNYYIIVEDEFIDPDGSSEDRKNTIGSYVIKGATPEENKEYIIMRNFIVGELKHTKDKDYKNFNRKIYIDNDYASNRKRKVISTTGEKVTLPKLPRFVYISNEKIDVLDNDEYEKYEKQPKSWMQEYSKYSKYQPKKIKGKEIKFQIKGSLNEKLYNFNKKKFLTTKYISQEDFDEKNYKKTEFPIKVEITPDEYAKLSVDEKKLYDMKIISVEISEEEKDQKKEAKEKYEEAVREAKEKGEEPPKNPFPSNVTLQQKKPHQFGLMRYQKAPVSLEEYQLGNFVQVYNIFDSFKNAVISLNMVITKHGEFRFSPYKRKTNTQMLDLIDDIRDKMEIIIEEIGE